MFFLSWSLRSLVFPSLVRRRDKQLRSDSFQLGMVTFWIPLAGQKCSFDHAFRHLALFSKVGFKIRGEIQRVFSILKQIFHALNRVIVLGELWNSPWFYYNGSWFLLLEIIKVMGFPVYRYVWKFLKIFRINGGKKNGVGAPGDHTNHAKVKGSLKKDKHRNSKCFSQTNEKSFVILTVQKFNLKYLKVKTWNSFLLIIYRTKGKWVNFLAQWRSWSNHRDWNIVILIFCILFYPLVIIANMPFCI